jgi:hypothetical protein
MAYELSKFKPEPSSLEVGSDTTEQNMTIADRDNETLARLGKKPVLKVSHHKCQVVKLSLKVLISQNAQY